MPSAPSARSTGSSSTCASEDHGAGLAVVELAARRFAGAPILVMSSYLEHHPINFSHRHGAAFAAKKLSREDLQAFAARVVSSRLGNPLVAEHVARRGRAWKLSPIEVEVLHWATLGRPRETYLERKDITIHAWKKHVRAIIHKKARAEVRDAPTLEAIVATILRDMVIPAPPPGFLEQIISMYNALMEVARRVPTPV